MRERLRILIGLIGHEWRAMCWSPVWMLGLAASVGFMFAESQPSVGWPPSNTALYGFGLACSVLLGIMAFLLAAGSLAADLDDAPSQLVFCRPIPLWLYLGGKYLAAVGLALAASLVLLATSLLRPVFLGVWVIYEPGPFLQVLGLCVAPMVIYACALAVFITVMTRRVLVALPVFLLYFFWAALASGGTTGDVNLLDFSMRLYSQDMVIDVPMRLTDQSFAHMLAPVHPALIIRAVLYVALSVLLLGGSWWVLNRRRDYGTLWPLHPFTRRTAAGESMPAAHLEASAS